MFKKHTNKVDRSHKNKNKTKQKNTNKVDNPKKKKRQLKQLQSI